MILELHFCMTFWTTRNCDEFIFVWFSKLKISSKVLPKCIPKWAGLALSLGLLGKIVNVKMTSKVILKNRMQKQNVNKKSLELSKIHAKTWNQVKGKISLDIAYSKVSIKRPVLLNGSISEKVVRNVLFIYLLTVPIKGSGLDFLKKSLFNDQYYLTGFIIETSE